MNEIKKNLFDVPVVYHIGYQKRDLAGFLDVLKTNGIDVLVDLREKPYSRVKGFSNRKLEAALNEVGIKYCWMGDKLGGFTLKADDWQKALPELAKRARVQTVVMMCMERNPNQCHRKDLVRILEDEHGLVGVAL